MNQRDYKAGTGSALIKTGRPREIDGNTQRKLVREAAKMPTATLKN